MDNFAQVRINQVEPNANWLNIWRADNALRGRYALDAWLGQAVERPDIWTMMLAGPAPALQAWERESPMARFSGVIERRDLWVVEIPDIQPTAHAAVIKQRVADFQRWKNVFDTLQAARSAGGISGVRVGHSVSDPCEVHLYAFVADPETYSKFVKSSALLDKLRSGGLIGSPEVLMVKHVAD